MAASGPGPDPAAAPPPEDRTADGRADAGAERDEVAEGDVAEDQVAEDDIGAGPDAAAEPAHLVVGHVSKPHGTKGEVLVLVLTDEPDRVFEPGRDVLVGDTEGGLASDADRLVIERTRPFKRGLLVKFEDHDDRNAVEPLAQRYLLVPTERLRPLEAGEVFYHQLLGSEVVTVDGEVVGRVREVYDTEPADLLDVKGAGGSHLIPFVERVVKAVDVERRRIVIEPPPGLLEL